MDKVIFQSKFRGLSIRVSASKSIKFHCFRYDTSDPTEIAFLQKKNNVWEVQGDPVGLDAGNELHTTIKEPPYSFKAKKERKRAKADPVIEPIPEPPKKGGRGRK